MTVSRLLKNGGFMALGSLLGGTGIVALEVFLIGKIGENDRLKDMMVETVKDMIKYAMFGEDRRRHRYPQSYGEYYNKNGAHYHTYTKHTEQHGFPWSGWNAVEKFHFETKDDVKEFVDKITEMLDMYHYVTIGDVLEMMGIHSCSTQEFFYGWFNADGVEIQKHDGGYVLRVPKPVHIAERQSVY